MEEEGDPLPADEERCRRRGTPNWRCPQRALPGKSHCLKHYLFYVSRRLRRKTEEEGGERISDECPADSSVEPYRPVIDFDSHGPPVETGDGTQVAVWTCEIMSRFAEVELWNGDIALDEPVGIGRKDDSALAGEIGGGNGGEIEGGQAFDKLKLLGKFEGDVNFDGVEVKKKKRGRPKESKNKKKGEESGDKRIEDVGAGVIDHDESVQNHSVLDHDHDEVDDDDEEVGHKKRAKLSGIVRVRQVSESDNRSEKDEGFGVQRAMANADGQKDEGLWEVPTIRNGGNDRIMVKKKRGRPKGSKNKPKMCCNGENGRITNGRS